jgi:hypothetical protein
MVFSLDLITGALGFLFTLLIFSYLIGDNPLFRIAVYAFVGISCGYIAAVIFQQVVLKRLFEPFTTAMISGSLIEKGLTLIPVIFALLIFMKISPRLAGMGRVAMAFLVGIAAAITIAGGLTGTLIPQVLGAINIFDLNAAAARNIQPYEAIGSGAITLAGTIFTLIYFHFGARPRADGSMRRLGLIEVFAWIGRIFIGITLGSIFAGVYAASLTALVERISSLINFVGKFL